MPEPAVARRGRAGLVALTLAFAVAVALVETTFAAAPTKTPRECTATAPAPPNDRCPLEISLGKIAQFSKAADPVAPGDTVVRPIDITNSGKLALAGVTLTTSHDDSGAVLADRLRLTVERCGGTWAASSAGYACSGGRTTLVDSSELGRTHDLGRGLSSLEPGGTDRLLATLAVPADLGDGAQGASTSITYSFTATQRTAK